MTSNQRETDRWRQRNSECVCIDALVQTGVTTTAVERFAEQLAIAMFRDTVLTHSSRRRGVGKGGDGCDARKA